MIYLLIELPFIAVCGAGVWLLRRWLRRQRLAVIKDVEVHGIDAEVALLAEVSRAQREERRGRRLASRLRARRAARMAAQVRRDKEGM
jgi:hypothetical protein